MEKHLLFIRNINNSMKYVNVYALFLVFVFHTSCGQNQTNSPKDNIKTETKDIITSTGSNDCASYKTPLQ